jgi:hypothetical protein
MYDRNYLEQRYLLPAIRDLVDHSTVLGAARFIELASFEPERLFTLVYTASEIRIEAVVGTTSLWESFPFFGQTLKQDGTYSELRELKSEPFVPEKAWRRSAVLRLPDEGCPHALRSSEALRTAGAAAPSCDSECLDGIGYRHRFCDRDSELYAEWSNPGGPEHAIQLDMIDAYVALLRLVNLYPDG